MNWTSLLTIAADQRERLCVCVCACVRARACVCEREREREREHACVGAVTFFLLCFLPLSPCAFSVLLDRSPFVKYFHLHEFGLSRLFVRFPQGESEYVAI